MTRLAMLVVLLSACAPTASIPTHIPPGHGWQCGERPYEIPALVVCNRECNWPPCHVSTGAWCYEFNARPTCFEEEAVCRAETARVGPEFRDLATECSFEP